MDIKERHVFLSGLTLAQLRALAIRWQIVGAMVKSAGELHAILVRIDGVEVPIEA